MTSPKPAEPHPAAPHPAEPPADAPAVARAAHLRYVNEDDPGIQRRRVGTGFSYRGLDGAAIRDPAELRRIRALAVPPAWTDVWICPIPNGHVLATGRDARGRKQYRYHPRWSAARDESKYDRTLAFGTALPRLRVRLGKDLARHGLPREKVLAAVVSLLEATLIRVGNEEYARTNDSYGLSTMLVRHASVDGSRIRFAFKGKGGKHHVVKLADRRLARIVERCQDLPGQRLFQYLDEDGDGQAIESTDINDYIREAAGDDFTAKDYRTWRGTVLAAQALLARRIEGEPPAKDVVAAAIEDVANVLGNTPTICRRCYVHPGVVEAYLEGSAIEALAGDAGNGPGKAGALRPEEVAVLASLRKRLKADGRAASGAA